MESGSEEPARRASRLAVGSWLFFDWAAQPFFTLVTTFVFAPYFAARVAADPVEGQALWGYAAAAAGLAVALLAPVLGAIADAAGRRKPWIAAFSVLLVAGSFALWYAVPGAGDSVMIALVAFTVATIGAEFATVFTNAMMPDLVEDGRLGRLSGTGWGIGYVGGLVSLVIVLGFLAGSPETGKTLFGLAPLFGLDPATGAGDRAAGPLSALWYVVFVLPLFLFTPDGARRLRLGAAIREGLGSLRATVVGLRDHRNTARYLLANMIYTDGFAALVVFGGIYAAGTFGWSAMELGLFGILLTVTGTIGAIAGGRLDDRLGPKRVVLAALAGLAVASLGILSIDPSHVLFVVPVRPPAPGDGLFGSPGEIAYLVLGAFLGLVAGPLQAASRTLLVRVSPREHMTQFFGLYALTGKVTSFVGPLAVGALTAASGSQRIGISVLVLFFLAGGAVLLGVRPERS
ncbi:MAG TPA: MFS transporter [Bauldia sp.]|nr:MFS transporter [Bauldia sp.]